MLRVIVDVNVVVSALINYVSPPAMVLQAVVERRLRLVASPELVGELDRVLHKPQLRRWFSLEDADRTVLDVRVLTPTELVTTLGCREDGTPEQPVRRRRAACQARGRLRLPAQPTRGGDQMIYSFVVTLDGADFASTDSTDADALYDAGCDDTLPVQDGPTARVIVDRDAPSFAAAVATALTAIETALPAARVLRVERVPPAGAEPHPLPHAA